MKYYLNLKVTLKWCFIDVYSTSLNHPRTKWDIFLSIGITVYSVYVKISEMLCTSYLGHWTDKLQI